MDAKKFWLHEFIAEKRTFVIPVYQRNYDWQKEHCEQLFNDIVHIIKIGKPHFIGTFVYMENSGADIFRELVIIDGQQRITSIILFAKALYDLTDDEELKEDIRSTFIKHSRGDLKGKCKLRPTEYDCDVFEKLMTDEPFDENNFTAQEKSSALYRNFLLFRTKIAATDYKIKEFFRATGKLTVVSILLEEENPQEIFESLNSTGLDLSKADLIRNFLLMSLLDYKKQEELYKNYWLEIENLLRPSDNVENFIMQYLIVKLKSNDAYTLKVNSKNLYFLFKKYFNDKCSDTVSCLKDMVRFAKFFRQFTFDADTKFENLSIIDKKIYELTFLLKSTNAPIILMYLFERNSREPFDEITFVGFIDTLISLTFRAKVCRNSGITPQFAGNVLARLDRKNFLDTNEFWHAIIDSSKVTFPNDKEFQAGLVNNSLYQSIKSDGCKYLLYSLEKAARSKELPAYSEATVEHILPQKPNADWKKYLTAHNDSQTHEIWLHTLGNLTLTAYNSELGNADFDAKKKIYAKSNYFYTRALKDFSEWTSKEIQLRAKKLAASAIKIWTLPEEFNSRFTNIGDTFNLDSDFGALTGTKPSSVFIFETKIPISNWIDLVREVAKQLYSLDSDIFRRAAQNENMPRKSKLFSTEPHTLQKPFKIDENFYMNLVLSTTECLKTVKYLAENFDRFGGTNFREEIYFTLRRG